MRKRVWCILAFWSMLFLGCVSAAADWYGTTYEVFVYSFCDGDGDGIGDLAGLAGKLDYIADAESGGLGCGAIWVTPIFPSPTYHKYDVTDYLAVDPDFGTMDDFDRLLLECRERGVRLLLDLPVNHTSSEHPWFLAAADYLRGLPEGEEPSAADCPYVEYYHFSKEAQSGYALLSGTEWYYEAQFWEGMPDLNLDSEAVRGEISAILRFWLERGVDGFRLDAVTSYYTGDQSSNLAFLTWLKAERAESADEASAADSVYFVGEAWTDQNSYASFYASGIDSFFDFAFAGQDGMIANVVRGSRSAQSFVDAMIAEEELYRSYNPEAVNAPFYTNHDMARSAGYYAYDDGTRTKLAEGLNLLMTGNAFLYYGEEIGMKGAGKDENKRAPMFWTDAAGDGATGEESKPQESGASASLPEGDVLSIPQESDASASLPEGAASSNPSEGGMCAGPPDMDNFDMKFGSAAEQMRDSASIYQYVREAVRIRKEFPVIARGRTVAVNPDAADGKRTDSSETAISDEAAALSGNAENDRYLAAFLRENEVGSESVLIVLNTGEAEAFYELRGRAAEYDVIAAELETGADRASIDGTRLTIPAFGIVVLTAAA